MTGRMRVIVPWLLVLGGPAAVGLAGLLLLLGFRDQLPDPVAVHWGADGADGFASPDRALLLVWTGPVAGAAFGALTLAVYRADQALRRHAASLATGFATFVTAVVVGSLWQQRGLADATAAQDPDLVLVVALLLTLAFGVGAAALAPGDRPGAAVATGPVPAASPRVPLGPDERVAWSAWTAASPAVLTVLAVALLPLAALAAAGIAPLFLLLVLLLVLVLTTATMSARVWVDQRGLTVRSPLGWPRHWVPLAEVAAAAAVDVHPLRDFGGWGYRIGRGGRSGVVLRRGPALEVTRGDGRRFVVTVDGAAEAAALLTALTARARG